LISALAGASTVNCHTRNIFQQGGTGHQNVCCQTGIIILKFGLLLRF